MKNKKNSGMTEIVKTVTMVVEGAIFVFGLNIVLYGHLSPGGGFAGGLILAFLFILLFLSYGKEGAFEKVSLKSAHVMDSSGIIAFLFIGVLGVFIMNSFLINFIQKNVSGSEFELISAGIIPIENIAIGLKVATSVFLVFAVLSMFRISSEPEEKGEENE